MLPSRTHEQVEKLKVTVTPADQIEKAAAKRVKNKRGPGKRKGKKAHRAESEDEEDEAGDEPEEEDMGSGELAGGEATGSGEAEKEDNDEEDEAGDRRPAKRKAPKSKATPKATAKASAKAKAKGKAKAKAKAKSVAKDKPEDKPAVKPKAGAKKTEIKEPVETEALGASVKQRRVDLAPRRWVYEILKDQTYGCAGCRFLFGGCTGCRKDSFRGKGPHDFAASEEYVSALAKLDAVVEEKPAKRRRGSPSDL